MKKGEGISNILVKKVILVTPPRTYVKKNFDIYILVHDQHDQSDLIDLNDLIDLYDFNDLYDQDNLDDFDYQDYLDYLKRFSVLRLFAGLIWLAGEPYRITQLKTPAPPLSPLYLRCYIKGLNNTLNKK